MPRTEQANQRVRADQRLRILEAARRVFARKGLSATVDDVAIESGVSHGLAYRYFTNKTALFSELVVQDLQAPPNWLEHFAAEQGEPMDKIRQMITGLLDSRREHPERYQLLAQALVDETLPDDLRERVSQRGRTMRAVLRELIVAGQASGEIARDDPDQLVHAIFAVLEGLTTWGRAEPESGRANFPNAEIILRMLKP
jgi:AcrR family transcriptional regulator